MSTSANNPNPAAQSAEFKKAAQDVTKLKSDPGNESKLKLYGLYKVGSDEKIFEKTPVPGMLDFTGKAKHNAWKEQVNAKLSPDAAQKEYVSLVEQLKKEKGFSG